VVRVRIQFFWDAPQCCLASTSWVPSKCQEQHTQAHSATSHCVTSKKTWILISFHRIVESQHIKNYIISSAEMHLTLLLFSKASFKRTFCFFAPNTTFLHFPINTSTCNRSSSAKFGSALLSSFCDVLSMLLTFGCSVSTSSSRAYTKVLTVDYFTVFC
jgi:hypothetical protein